MNTPDTEWEKQAPYSCNGDKSCLFGCPNCRPDTNTPDTEWEKELRKEIQMFFYDAEHPEVYSSYEIAMFERKVEGIISIFQNTVSSRDTYWKERVRKEVEGMRWKTNHIPFSTDEQIERCTCKDCQHNKTLDTLLDTVVKDWNKQAEDLMNR